jgi:hypothetical protein
MFDLSKIITGLNDLKETIAKNRVKNLRAEIAGKVLVQTISLLGVEKFSSNPEGCCEESVRVADQLLKALGESNA